MGYDFAMIRARQRCGESPGQAYKNDIRVERQMRQLGVKNDVTMKI